MQGCLWQCRLIRSVLHPVCGATNPLDCIAFRAEDYSVASVKNEIFLNFIYAFDRIAPDRETNC